MCRIYDPYKVQINEGTSGTAFKILTKYVKTNKEVYRIYDPNQLKINNVTTFMYKPIKVQINKEGYSIYDPNQAQINKKG